MDENKAQHVARRAAAAAGRVLLHHDDHDDHDDHDGAVEQQTLTIARPVETVLQSCRDPDVLNTLVGSVGTVHQRGPGEVVWTVAGTTVPTQVHVETNRVVHSAGAPESADFAVTVEAWPAPQGLGAEVVLRVAVPAAIGTAVGGLAFTMLYRLRALLQTGEVPTLGDVPSGRSQDVGSRDDSSLEGRG